MIRHLPLSTTDLRNRPSDCQSSSLIPSQFLGEETGHQVTSLRKKKRRNSYHRHSAVIIHIDSHMVKITELTLKDEMKS